MFYLSYAVKNIQGEVIGIDHVQIPVSVDAVDLEVLTVTNDVYRAINVCIGHGMNHPNANYQPRNVGDPVPRDKAVLCRETGEVFNSLAAAVAKNGGSVSALSSHLNGRKGYKTVKGFTYLFHK